MKWKYYIPHVWERERELWEDVYLLPDVPIYDGESIWLTVDALGIEADPFNLFPEEYFEKLEKLGDKDFFIDGTDMVVRADLFTKSELLEWVKIWLAENELPVDELIEGTIEEFAGTNNHACLVADLKSTTSDDE